MGRRNKPSVFKGPASVYFFFVFHLLFFRFYYSEKIVTVPRLNLNYAVYLSILDESFSKMNEFLDVLLFQGARFCLRINVKSRRLGISEDEKVMLGNEKIRQGVSFTYLGSIISKDGGCSKGVKSRIAEAQGIFSQMKKV